MNVLFDLLPRSVEFILVFFWLSGFMSEPDNPSFAKPLEYHAPTFKKLYFGYFVSEEILDKRQSNIYFLRNEDIEKDLQYISDIIKNIYHLPKVRDFHLFEMYSREDVCKFIEVNREFHRRLEHRKELFPNDHYISNIIKENQKLYEIYDDIRDVKAAYYYIQLRRMAIGRIIERIGYENYFYGRVPPNLPVWHFQRIP